jgi:hypothetical protein
MALEFIRREKQNDFMENRFEEFILYHKNSYDYIDTIYNFNANVLLYPFFLLHYFSKLYLTKVKNKFSNIDIDAGMHDLIGLVKFQLDSKYHMEKIQFKFPFNMIRFGILLFYLLKKAILFFNNNWYTFYSFTFYFFYYHYFYFIYCFINFLRFLNYIFFSM